MQKQVLFTATYFHHQKISWSLGNEMSSRDIEAANLSKTQGWSVILRTDVVTFRNHPELAEEVFGPFALLIAAQTMVELEDIARKLDGQLTATVHGSPADLQQAGPLLHLLGRKADRLIINGFPTGVEV